jgi:hypothetical protein
LRKLSKVDLELAGIQAAVSGEGVKVREGFSFEFSEGGVCIIHIAFGEAEPVSGASVVAAVCVGLFKF